MKNKLNFQKYYNQLDPTVKDCIDNLTKDRSRQDESMVIERMAVENKEFQETTVEADKPTCQGWISKATTDHSSDFVNPYGVNTTVFDKNPIVFLNHNSGGLPVGKCVGMSFHNEGVKARTEFCTDVDFSNDVYKMIKGGFLNSFSIGFIPLDYTLRGEASFNELNTKMIEDFPLYDGNADRIISKWLLLEYSTVGIPDNWNAVVTDKSIELSDTTIKIITPAIDKSITKVIDKTVVKVIDRSVKVLDICEEQNIVKTLSDTQKSKIESYYLQTKRGQVLRYSISDIIEGRV